MIVCPVSSFVKVRNEGSSCASFCRESMSLRVTTGFSAMELLHYREQTAGGVWGIFLVSAKGCVVRDCRAYLNAWGIGMNSGEPDEGRKPQRCHKSHCTFGDSSE